MSDSEWHSFLDLRVLRERPRPADHHHAGEQGDSAAQESLHHLFAPIEPTSLSVQAVLAGIQAPLSTHAATIVLARLDRFRNWLSGQSLIARTHHICLERFRLQNLECLFPGSDFTGLLVYEARHVLQPENLTQAVPPVGHTSDCTSFD